MSNRPKRRDHDTHTWHTGRDDDTTLAMALILAANLSCPDCHSEATVDRDGPRVNVTLSHDYDCPWLAGVTR